MFRLIVAIAGYMIYQYLTRPAAAEAPPPPPDKQPRRNARQRSADSRAR